MVFSPSGPPQEPSPPAAVPNFSDPCYPCWPLNLTAALCLFLGLSSVLLRIYSKFYVIKKPTIDDYIITLACVCFIGACSVLMAACDAGHGRETNQRQLLQLVSACIYSLTTSIIKLALFVLMYRIFWVLRWLRYLIYLGVLSTLLFYSSAMFANIALCAPRHGQDYVESSHTPRCARTQTLGQVQGAVNVVSDFYLLVIPIRAVWTLQMPRRKRLGVIGIFMVGLMACVASCIGLWIRIRIWNGSNVEHNVVNIWILSMVETAIGIFVASAPAVSAIYRQENPPLARFFASIRAKVDSTSLSTGSSHDSPRSERTTGGEPASESASWANESRIELAGGRNDRA